MAALILFLIVSTIIVCVVWRFVSRWRTRQGYLDDLVFPADVARRVRTRYPHLSEGQITQVEGGLKDYLRIYRIGASARAVLPSRVVEAAWRAFAENDVAYKAFCETMFGKLLECVPSEAPGADHGVSPGLQSSWTGACSLEGINPDKPKALPRLFRLDRELEISDGHRYFIGEEETRADGFDVCLIGRHVELV